MNIYIYNIYIYMYVYMYVDIYNKHIFCPMPGMHDNFALFLMIIGIGIVVIDLHFHGFPK